ncbi:methyl-accepting chemotaxis protein [Aestuariirhabdus litorea]|uniref:Methyl-accepting chemotaxis protein n=1 Tax=Aestuariirhabdus litorea TaxID=2528527 RepID=A0A3P3VTA4_9GAMM|nr:methyl-accepting chemotaxis protein [Aestuariirhabdus litorea]RRJ83993.1 methyl-accepting chemotaxis protein [Aestuariirhabdus litorea]RWW97213.1 HAMP domain-containing protein [Endozoicomonadaceae bacterium GTF-13]
MKISKKLGGGYLLMVLMVILCTSAGLYGVNRLSSLLDFITGPAWDTADGAMEGSIGIEAEMIGVGLAISGQADTSVAMAIIDEGTATAKEALGRMINAGLLNDADIETLNRQQSAFNRAQDELLSSHQQFAGADQALRNSFSAFQALMVQAEELGDSAVESLENNPNQLTSWNSGLAEKWSAADGGMETQIEMLSRFFYYQSLIELLDPSKTASEKSIREGLSDSLEGLREKVGEIAIHPLFMQEQVASGQFQGQDFASSIKTALDQHERDSQAAIDAFESFRTANVQYQQIAAELLDTIGVIEESADSKVEGQLGAVTSAKTISFSLMLIALAVSIILAAAVMYFVVREIIHAIEGMSYASTQIADGDLTIQMCRPGQNATNDELAQLNHNMGRMADGLRDTISQVATTSSMLASQAEELSMVANETKDSVLEQQKRTTSVASAITEMTASSREVAENTVSAKESAERAQEVSLQGREVVDETVTTIRSLATKVSETANVIEVLTQDSEKIGKVLDVIRGIAEQTNLLALNAAIEAARAGEQGRGFAVVADEVRTLAQRTQESTQEIQTVIQGLQQRTQQAHEAMRSSEAQVDESTSRVTKTGEALNRIAAEVELINEQNTQIAAAMCQQEAATEEINLSVIDIDNQASQAVSAVNQTSESSRELARQAGTLQDLVARFKI